MGKAIKRFDDVVKWIENRINSPWDDVNNPKVDIPMSLYFCNPIVMNDELNMLLNFDEEKNESYPGEKNWLLR